MADLQELYPNFDTPERGRIKTVAASVRWLRDAIGAAYSNPNDSTHDVALGSFKPTEEAVQAMEVASQRVTWYHTAAEEAIARTKNSPENTTTVDPAMLTGPERVLGYQVRAEAEALVKINNNSLDPEVLSEKDRALYWSRIAQEMASDKPIHPVFEETIRQGTASNEQFGLVA